MRLSIIGEDFAVHSGGGDGYVYDVELPGVRLVSYVVRGRGVFVRVEVNNVDGYDEGAFYRMFKIVLNAVAVGFDDFEVRVVVVEFDLGVSEAVVAVGRLVREGWLVLDQDGGYQLHVGSSFGGDDRFGAPVLGLHRGEGFGVLPGLDSLGAVRDGYSNHRFELEGAVRVVGELLGRGGLVPVSSLRVIMGSPLARGFDGLLRRAVAHNFSLGFAPSSLLFSFVVRSRWGVGLGLAEGALLGVIGRGRWPSGYWEVRSSNVAMHFVIRRSLRVRRGLRGVAMGRLVPLLSAVKFPVVGGVNDANRRYFMSMSRNTLRAMVDDSDVRANELASRVGGTDPSYMWMSTEEFLAGVKGLWRSISGPVV